MKTGFDGAETAVDNGTDGCAPQVICNGHL